jgi:hypothetical protein
MNRWVKTIALVLLVLVSAMVVRNFTVNAAPAVAHTGGPVPPNPWLVAHTGGPVPPNPWQHTGGPVPPNPWTNR